MLIDDVNNIIYQQNINIAEHCLDDESEAKNDHVYTISDAIKSFNVVKNFLLNENNVDDSAIDGMKNIEKILIRKKMATQYKTILDYLQTENKK